MSSQARQLCYPRSNFSVISSPHQGGHRGSLGHNFLFESNLSMNPIRLAYTLAFHTGFLTRLSQPLGSADTISAECHPSQTVHLLLSSLARVSSVNFEKYCFIFAYYAPESTHLTATTYSKHQNSHRNNKLQ
jgi:hypothetical protein